jgi:hypothetical protein
MGVAVAARMVAFDFDKRDPGERDLRVGPAGNLMPNVNLP